MRSTARRLVQIIPKSAIPQSIVRPALRPQTEELNRPTLIDILLERKANSTDWPQNLRIEPVVKKEAFRHVQAEARTELKKMLKER